MDAYALFFLVAIAIGGVAYVFIYPILSGERNAERRVAAAARSEPITRSSRTPLKTRREQVEGSLKELEQRQKKAKRPPLSVRISQAGLSWSKRRFIMISVGLGVFAFFAMIPMTGSLLTALAFGFTAGCGIPLWLLEVS